MSDSTELILRTVAHASPEYLRALDLRHRILRAPLGLSYSDADIAAESAAVHFVALRESEIVATMQLVQAKENDELKMRQVAVAAALQGKGIGRQLVRFAEQRAWEGNCRRIVLHARQSVIPFYESLGYQASGEVFLEVGIPHRFMQRERPPL